MVHLNQSFQVVVVLRRAEILFKEKIHRTSKVMMNMETAGNKTQLLVFVDISVIKLVNALIMLIK